MHATRATGPRRQLSDSQLVSEVLLVVEHIDNDEWYHHPASKRENIPEPIWSIPTATTTNSNTSNLIFK